MKVTNSRKSNSDAVSWNGVSKSFFVERSTLKPNCRPYLEHVRNDLIPGMKELYPNINFTFFQDSTSSHRAKIVQHFL